VGATSLAGATLLSTVTWLPLRSFICPPVTTTSPAASALVTATWSPRVPPSSTKRWVATPVDESTTNTVSPYGL
jgi:hypothetical protein